MSEDTITFPYDFDPYAENESNVVPDEGHTITAVNGGDFNFIVPRYAPFFRRGFICRDKSTGLPLRPDVDYFFGFRFDQVIVSGSSLPVYGAIVFLDKTLSANVEITYHTLGGEFSQSENTVLELMANKSQDPRKVQWGAVVDLPTEFPPIAHRHDVDDLTGFSDVIAAINSLADANEAGFNKAMQALLEHVRDHNNPHQITLADLGIDDLGNLVPATKEQAEGGVDNTYYMTSLRVSQQFQKVFLPLLESHESDTSNPHAVTKAQVGLGLVENYRPANALEAAAGVADNVILTPATGLQLANAVVPDIMLPHTSNKDNPHSVTAAQVGLGNVPNFAMATDEEAILGVSKTTVVTPYLVNLVLSNASNQPLSQHINNKNNPHEVTATQVGLGNVPNYPAASELQAQSANRNDLLLTPGGLGYWWTNSAKEYVDLAIATGTNLNAEDVGLGSVVNAGFATDAQNTAGTVENVYVDPAGVTTAMAANVIERRYTASPAFMAKLITGFPASLLSSDGEKLSTGRNAMWTNTLRTLTSPLHTTDQTSFLLTTAPATYSQRAYVDVTNANTTPGFVFGRYAAASGDTNLAAIFFKNGSVYLGTRISGTWTYGTAVTLAALTGSSILVSCSLTGTSMSVTVGSTTVSVDVSSITFTSTTFALSAGFVVVGKDQLIFTPNQFPGYTAQIVDVIGVRRFIYSANAWTEDTSGNAIDTGTDLRAGRVVVNRGTGEGFICLGDGNYFTVNAPYIV